MQYILTQNSLTVVLDNGIPRSINRNATSQQDWDRAIKAVSEDDFDTIRNILDKSGNIKEYFKGYGLDVKGGMLYYGNYELDTYPARRAMEFVEQGLPAASLIKFLKRVEATQKYSVRQNLYSFLEFNNMPLTENGCFMAYKKVRKTDEGNFVDIHTGTFNNNPGQIVHMPRHQVDDDPDRPCSCGLHVCSYDYLPHFGSGHWDTAVAVKVPPENVVVIPKDHNQAKIRVSAYIVKYEIPDYFERGHIWEDTPFVDDDDDDDDDDDIDHRLFGEI